MLRERRAKKLISRLNSSITGLTDFFGESKPSVLFFFMIRIMSPLLSCNPNKMFSKYSVLIRKVLHPILMKFLPLFLEYKQVFESKNELLGIDAPDVPMQLTNEPVIWCPNHGFKDDVAASIRSVRHSYILFGSFPMFFNTFDGVGAFINGVVMCNRKTKNSKIASFETSKQLLNMGMDMLIFPEGVWNKTPDKLMLNLWPGAYRLAKETGCKIVPVIHYLADPVKKYEGNVIHTVIAEPISIGYLDEQEGLKLLRDTMATWYYYLMEKYGQSTRKKLLEDFITSDDAWESNMTTQINCVKYYDKEIELCADYRPKEIVRPEDVWANIANIKNINVGNITHVIYAKKIISRERRRDFQRRF